MQKCHKNRILYFFLVFLHPLHTIDHISVEKVFRPMLAKNVPDFNCQLRTIFRKFADFSSLLPLLFVRKKGGGEQVFSSRITFEG